MMNYLSLCSGIEAATVAWEPLGWKAVAFSEIDAFPSAVLGYHYPEVPNFGDMTKYKEWDIEPGTVDVIVGGTPCQSFSVAGLRKGLDDPRGNLMLTYLVIADALRPKWLVWENVPGVLSSHKGRDFGTFLGGLAQLGYGFAYRVLDAQYFGLAQRRKRVFVVGCLGDWRSAAAVLFERESLCRYPPPSRKTGQAVAGTITGGFGERGVDADQVAAVAQIQWSSGGGKVENDTAQALRSNAEHNYQFARVGKAVRRLTPVESERLQGFPDGYTQIPWRGKPAEYCPDGPRYKALGNSMAVPVMRCIGERIDMVETACTVDTRASG